MKFYRGKEGKVTDIKTISPMPRLMWLSGLSAGLWTKRLPVQFPVRADAWVVGQVPSWEHARGNLSMFLSHIDVSFPPFLLPFPSF